MAGASWTILLCVAVKSVLSRMSTEGSISLHLELVFTLHYHVYDLEIEGKELLDACAITP